MSGIYPMSWFYIAQNLSVPPDKIIQVYQESEDQKQFHNNIIEIQNPAGIKGADCKWEIFNTGTCSRRYVSGTDPPH